MDWRWRTVEYSAAIANFRVMAGPFCLFRLRSGEKRELETRTGHFKMAVSYLRGFLAFLGEFVPQNKLASS